MERNRKLMKKIINNPDNVVAESMEGFIACYSKLYTGLPGVNAVVSKNPRKDKVVLVVGGGSGHEPMFGGFVGQGLADAAACGNIFASPDPGTIYETAKAVESGKGVLFLYGNYAGDNLNFDMAEELLADEDIKSAHIRVWDDCASAPLERKTDRRGIAGDVFMIKIAGAACDAGLSLEEIVELLDRTRENLRSIGVATSPGQIPGLDKPTFEIGEDELEYGMGIHGERGISRTKMKPADEITEFLYRNITPELRLAAGDEVCVLINGLGSTTIAEMSIVYRKLSQLLEADGLSVYDAEINSFCTCQEMGGFSITLLKMNDELKRYYDMPCCGPYLCRGVCLS